MRRRFPPPSFRRRSVVGFTVDETGNVTQWRFLDNTCEGKDSVGVEPATPRTREAMTEALGRLEKWTPAMKDGKPTTYSWRLTMRLPVKKIAKKQDADPLLFLGGDPDKTFHEWASPRLRYDGRFTGRGAKGEGVVAARANGRPARCAECPSGPPMNTGSIFWGWSNDAPETPGGDESGRRKREAVPLAGRPSRR